MCVGFFIARVPVPRLWHPITPPPTRLPPGTFFAGINPANVPLGVGVLSTSITAAQSTDFQSKVYVPIRAAAGIRWAGVVIGGLGAVAAVLFSVRATLKARRNAAEPESDHVDDGDYLALTEKTTAGRRPWTGGMSVQ